MEFRDTTAEIEPPTGSVVEVQGIKAIAEGIWTDWTAVGVYNGWASSGARGRSWSWLLSSMSSNG